MTDVHAPNPGESIAGVDEAGRGCLAGPVVAAAVILPSEFDLPGLTDSKKLTAAKRTVLYSAVRGQAVAWAIGVAWPQEIDEINILQATLQSMRRAVLNLSFPATRLLIDGNQRAPIDLPQQTVVKGDLTIPCISAASIIAKTFRDHLMTRLERRYPGYGLAGHKGYGTAEHLAAIRKLGPCRIHRKTFKGVKPEPHKEVELCLPGL